MLRRSRRPRRLCAGTSLRHVPHRRLVFELRVDERTLARVEDDWEGKPWVTTSEAARVAPPRRRALVAVAAAAIFLLSAALAAPAPAGSALASLQDTVAAAEARVAALLAEAGENARAPFEWLGRRAAGGEVALEATNRLELAFADPARAQAFLVGKNLAPGDVVEGEVELLTRGPPGAGATLWLDLEARPAQAPSGTQDLAASLLVTRLDYGGTPVAMPEGADADGNGHVDLRELAGAPAVPLAAPAPDGTRLRVQVTFDPRPPADAGSLPGQSVEAVFVFTLTEGPDAR